MVYEGKEIGKLGFGMMRLPMIDNEIDIEHVKKMVDVFLENGFTYFDTAYGYHNQKSEGAVKKALVDRYPRESYQLATKLPAWAGAKSADEAKNMFYTSLERTGVEYFDYYLLHNLGSKRTQIFEDFGIWDFLSEQKALGKIKKLGFSIHDTADVLEGVLAKHSDKVDFVQLQINYADWEDLMVQSRKCYEVARKYGKDVIVMEPVRGGTLANPPKAVADLLKEANADVSLVSWALRFVASLDGIGTILSGMSNLDQIKENIDIMRNVAPLNEKEQEIIRKVQELIKSTPSIPCTNCQYCVKECPMNIEIHDMLGAMNRVLIYDDLKSGRTSYSFAQNKGGSASDCIKCGACEAVCPQTIKITEELERIAEELEV